MSINTEQLQAAIKQLNFNPTEVMRLFLRAVEEQSNGAIGIFDPSGPVQLAIEAAAINTVGELREIETITRRLYPPAISDWSSLYLHMQDEDNHNISAQPGKVPAYLIVSVEELKRNAVAIDDVSGVRMVRFPAHTQITVNDIKLMLVRPVTIRLNKHNNISVKYDLNEDSVFPMVSDAVINFTYNYENDMEILRIPVECIQCGLVSQELKVSPSSGFKQRIKLNSKFFRIKAFTKFRKSESDVTSPWIEIDVTHRMKVLNKNKTTIQVENLGSELVVTIPHFYFNNNMVGNEVRLDIYTTAGEMEHSLVNYSDASYELRYYDYNNPKNVFSGILGSFKVLRCHSVGTISGGRDAMSFDEAKNIVINRSTISEGLPITEKEIVNRLGDYNFTTVKIKDNVTDRLYAASRLLPTPTNLTATGIGCNVQMLQTTFAEMADLSTARVNGSRLTVLPSTLYTVDKGVLKVVDAELVNRMTNPAMTAPENLAAWANANTLVYSPYYYVHDISNNEYNVRTYRLDKPIIKSKVTVNENPTLQLDAGVFNYEMIVDQDGGGYRLYLGISVGTNFLELDPANVSLQISYLDESGNNRYYLNGTLATPIDPATGRPVDNNYIYRFDFLTDWDIDDTHHLILSGGALPMPLSPDLDVFIIVKDFAPPGFSKTEMDNLVNVTSLENFDGRGTQYALIQERISLEFGKYMKNLWSRSRTTIDDADYKRYTENVPSVYDEDVVERDGNKVIVTVYNKDLGYNVPSIKYRKGDPVMDPETGLPIYKHHINEIVKEFGQPVYKEGLRGLKRQFDLVVFDGLYYLSTHEDTLKYVRTVLDTIDTWVFDVIETNITPELLQRTTVLFHPKSTVGMIEVYVENGYKVLINSSQAFFVRLFVNSMVMGNPDLRNNLETIAKTTIQTLLSTATTISQTDITSAIKTALGENVMGIEVKGFMEDKYNTITVVDGLTTPSIGKRLVVNSKLELVVEDNVEFEFVDHTRRQTV